jgi:hypothetical protein
MAASLCTELAGSLSSLVKSQSRGSPSLSVALYHLPNKGRRSLIHLLVCPLFFPLAFVFARGFVIEPGGHSGVRNRLEPLVVGLYAKLLWGTERPTRFVDPSVTLIVNRASSFVLKIRP